MLHSIFVQNSCAAMYSTQPPHPAIMTSLSKTHQDTLMLDTKYVVLGGYWHFFLFFLFSVVHLGPQLWCILKPKFKQDLRLPAMSSALKIESPTTRTLSDFSWGFSLRRANLLDMWSREGLAWALWLWQRVSLSLHCEHSTAGVGGLALLLAGCRTIVSPDQTPCFSTAYFQFISCFFHLQGF